MKLKKWDSIDFITEKNGKTNMIGIKSSKDKAKLLMLETNAWMDGGYYKFGKDNKPCKYDAIVFVRIKYNFDNHIQSLLQEMAELFNENENESIYEDNIISKKDELEKKILSKKWFFDIPGYITNEDLCYIIRKVLEYFFKYIKILFVLIFKV